MVKLTTFTFLRMEEVYVALTVGLGAVGLVITWLALRGKATPLKDVYNVPVARIEKLYVYPFKSCHRIEVQTSDCQTRGFKYDRYLCLCINTMLLE